MAGLPPLLGEWRKPLPNSRVHRSKRKIVELLSIQFVLFVNVTRIEIAPIPNVQRSKIALGFPHYSYRRTTEELC